MSGLTATATESRPRFSLPVSFGGLAFLLAAFGTGGAVFFLGALSGFEEEQGLLPLIVSWCLLLVVVVYAVGVAPFLWPRATSTGARVAVLVPHALFALVAVLGVIG
jgi:hypothetical protein